jgi:hypothetical protein
MWSVDDQDARAYQIYTTCTIYYFVGTERMYFCVTLFENASFSLSHYVGNKRYWYVRNIVGCFCYCRYLVCISSSTTNSRVLSLSVSSQGSPKPINIKKLSSPVQISFANNVRICCDD